MAICTDDLSALSRLLDEMLGLGPARAEAWLADLPAQHQRLRPPLRQLLAGLGTDEEGRFLSEGPRLNRGAGEEVARAGELVGPYRLIRELGRGGMGLVWLAEPANVSPGRPIALKLPHQVWGAGLAERMARERDICARLEHPDIVRLLDAGTDGFGRPYLAFECIDGTPLDVWCTEQALSVPERLRLFLQVARAVAHAHACRIVHRDLKPANVLVSGDGQAHLLDFGIAKLLDPEGPGSLDLTGDHARVLTPHCASPEQLRGEAATVTSDVYSLGVMLYELLTGQHPYAGDCRTISSLERAVLAGPPLLASERMGNKASADLIAGGLDAILAKALRYEPVERYATADAMADAVEQHLAIANVPRFPDLPSDQDVVERGSAAFKVAADAAAPVRPARAEKFLPERPVRNVLIRPVR